MSENTAKSRTTRRSIVFSATESQSNGTWNTSRHVQRATERFRNSRPGSSYSMKQLEEKFAKRN